MVKIKGFTLVELLVVISIIALLLSILMPSLNAARQQAYSVVCKSNMKNLSMAWFMYQDGNEGNLIGAHTDSYMVSRITQPWQEVYKYCWVACPQKENGGNAYVAPTEQQEKYGIERGLLFPYLKKVEVYHCGADKRTRRGLLGWRTYSIAGCMNGAWTRASSGGIPIPSIKKYTQVKRASDSYVFVEETTGPRAYNRNAWQFDYPANEFIDPVAVLHNNKSNFAFADGHVDSHKWTDKRTIAYSKGEIGRAEAGGEAASVNKDLKYLHDGWTIKSKSAYE